MIYTSHPVRRPHATAQPFCTSPKTKPSSRPATAIVPLFFAVDITIAITVAAVADAEEKDETTIQSGHDHFFRPKPSDRYK